MVKAHGIDLVEIRQFGLLCESEKYLKRCFTVAEVSQCNGRPDRLAARFAAKEAVLKAVSLGLVNGVSLHDVEVAFTAGGTPTVHLKGLVLDTAERLGIDKWYLSFSHGAEWAIASVIGCGG